MTKHQCLITSCSHIYSRQTFTHTTHTCICIIHPDIRMYNSFAFIYRTVSDDFFSVVRTSSDEISNHQGGIYIFVKNGRLETILKLSGSNRFLVHWF